MTNLRLIAYTPNGASLGPLPTPETVQMAAVKNDLGALTLDYSPEGARAALLGQPLEVAVEVSSDQGQTWSEPPSGRFLYLRDGRDPIKTGDSWKIEAPGYAWRLQKALVGTTGLNTEGRVEFITKTPGAILTVLWDLAQSRGALEGMTRTWSATQDSAGTPWPESFSMSYEPGAHLLSILQGMAESGWLDFRTQGRSVQVYVADHPSGMGRDKTVGALPVTLRFGRDLTEAPFRRTWEGLADTAIVLGDEGKTVTRINPAAAKPWGVQETFVTASGVTDDGTLSVLGDAALTFTEQERAEHTLGLEFAATPHLPFRDYLPGDWVQAATTGTADPVRMRVQGITLTRDVNGSVGGNVTLNDRFLEADVLQNRRIQKIINGATQAGSGGAPGGIGPDILAPAKVVGLAGSSAAYVVWQDGGVRSQITLNWNDVTQNMDGTPTTDVAGYQVWARIPGQGDWYMVAETSVSQWTNSPYEPGVTWEFQVRAVDTSYNFGLFSDSVTVTTVSDLTPPPPPSAPTATSRLGTARITWNGLTQSGADMADTVRDFRYVIAHVSQVNNFTPDETTRVGELIGPGYVVAGPLNYAATYYARLVAYDSSGNASAASAQVTITVAALVDVSNFPDSAMETLYARTAHFIDVTADMLLANAVKTMHLESGAVTTEKLTIGARAVSILRNSYMEEANANGEPLHWTLRWGWAEGTVSGETAAPISGTRSLRLTCNTTGGGMVLGDTEYFPVVAGLKYYARATVRAVVATTRDVRLSGRSSTVTHTPISIFAGANQSTTTLDLIGAASWAAGETRILEGNWTVPANHVLGGVTVDVGTGAVGDAFIIDSIECWPATTDAQITEVGAGKIVTGILQATQRIVAGTLTGARAEMNGVGFQAFNPAGTKMFEVQANSGDTYVGNPSGIHIRMGAYANAWNGNVSQAILRFGFTGSGWNDGQIHTQYWSDSGVNWAALRITSPWVAPGGFADAPYLDLRQNNSGGGELYIRSHLAYLTANTFVMGSTDGTSNDFRAVHANGFAFSDYSQTSRLRLMPMAGYFTIRSANSTGNTQNLRIQGQEVIVETNGQDLTFSDLNNLGIRSFNKNMALLWQSGRLVAASYAGNLHQPMEASAFTVVSDPRLKSDATPVKGALEAVKALQVYDYDMVGILPRRSVPDALSLPGAKGPLAPPQANRARGVMADEVQRVLPDAVNENEDGQLSVSLYDLLATTVAALRELAAEVDTLKATQSPRRNP